MGQVELFMVAIGLSMDAFAVSLCKGHKMRKLNYKHALIIAAFFGGFQVVMPLLGWLLGQQFEHYISSFDHWIAFFLLTFIGGNMLVAAFKGSDDFSEYNEQLDIKELLKDAKKAEPKMKAQRNNATFSGRHPLNLYQRTVGTSSISTAGY